jgi:hypothetical protein
MPSLVNIDNFINISETAFEVAVGAKDFASEIQILCITMLSLSARESNFAINTPSSKPSELPSSEPSPLPSGAPSYLPSSAPSTSSKDIDSSSRSRRRLLQEVLSVEDAQQSRALFLTSLWQLTEITPITSLDIASLLNAIAILVDAPNELDANTGSSSMQFIEYCLRAIIAKGVGITDGGSTLVGQALSSLMLVPPLFNASERYSLQVAANITSLVRLLSAAQMSTAFPTGKGRITSADLFEMYSYRSSGSDLRSPASITSEHEYSKLGICDRFEGSNNRNQYI